MRSFASDSKTRIAMRWRSRSNSPKNRQTGDARHRPRHRHRRRDGRLAGPNTTSRPKRHTRVTVVVPAETDVLFTPSQLRVKSLSWTGDAEQSAETLRERVTKLWEDDRLEQRTYEVTGSEGEIVTVDLENPETGDRIEEWHATYTLAGDEAARPTPLAGDG